MATYYQPSSVAVQLTANNTYDIQHTVYQYAGSSFSCSVTTVNGGNWSETGGAPTPSPGSGSSGSSTTVSANGAYFFFESGNTVAKRRLVVQTLSDPSVGTNQNFNTSTQSNQFVHTIGDVSGGTSGAPVQYGYSVSSARNTNNPGSTPTWLSGNTLTVVRGYYYRFFVRVSSPSGGNASGSVQVPYIPNNTGASFTSGSSDFIASGASSFNLSVSNCAQYHAYRLGTNTSFGNISPTASVYTGSGSGTFNINVTNSMNNYPSSGGSSTYYLYASRSSTFGGPGDVGFNSAGWTYLDSITVYSVIAPTVNNTQNFNTTTASNIISHTVSLSNAGANGTLFYALSKGSARGTNNPNPFNPTSSYQTNATFFNIERGYYYYFYAYRSGNGIVDRNNTALQVPYIPDDMGITVNGNAPASPRTNSAFTESLTANTFSTNAQTTDTIAIAGAQIGDEIRVIYETGALLVDFFTITATSFNITVPTNTTRFPPGQSKLVRVQIRRPLAAGGDNSNATALTYTYQRPLNQAVGRILTSSGTGDITFGSTSTIGATAYIAAGNGSTGSTTAMDLVVSSGPSSGTDYRIKVTSGTTNGGSTAGTGFTPITATTTSFTEFLAESRLPNVNASVSYKIEARDNSSTGDGVWYECYRTIAGTFAGTQFKASFTVTRSNYVSPDTSITHSTSATATDVNARSYQIGSSSTSETITYSGGSASTQYRVLEVIGNNQCDTNTGASGTLTIPNAFLPTTTDRIYWVQARVTTANNGNNQWVNTDDYAYTGPAYIYQVLRESLATPTAVTLSAYKNASDSSKIVPSLSLTWNGGTGEVEYAFSTTNSSPTNWTGTGFTGGTGSLVRVSGPSTSRASNALYMGVRQKSAIDGTTTTPSYASNTSGPYYNEVGTQDNFIQVVYDGDTFFPADGDMPVVIPASDTSNDITVTGFSKQAYTETEVSPNSLGNGSVGSSTEYASYRIRTSTADSNIGASGTLVGSDTTNSSGTVSFNLANPSDLPAGGNTVSYVVKEFVFAERGGRATESSTIPTIDNQVSVSRLAAADGTVNITVPNTTIGATSTATETISLANGNNNTQYRIRVTASTGGPSVNDVVGESIPSTTTTSFGLVTSELPTEGKSVTYKVEYREVGTSAYLAASGTNTTFTINRLAAADGNVTINPGTTQFYNNPGGFSTVTLSNGNSNTEYRLIVSASTTNLPSVGTVVDTDTPTGTTASFSINPVTEKPPIGQRVTYQVQFRASGSTSAFANCTGTNTTFTMATLNADALALTDGVSPNDRSTSTAYDSISKTANGIATTQTFSISGTGAEFSVNGGTMNNTSKSVSEGDSIVVRLTTASTFSASRTATLGFPGLTTNTKTWTLTTGASGGSGNDGGDSGAGGTYGLQINNSSGNNLIDANSRVSRLVGTGSVVVDGGGNTSSSISVTGLTTSDDWSIVVTVGNANVASAGQIDQFSVNRTSGSFTITNNTVEQESGSNDDRRRFYWRVYKTG